MHDRPDNLSEFALQDTQIESNETTKHEHYQNVGPTASTAGEPYQTGWRLALIIFPLCLGTLLVAIDNTIIAVAIPKISSTFKALDQVAWYGSGYLLTVTAFQPTFGKLYKYFNVKLTYLVSIGIFEGKPHPVPRNLSRADRECDCSRINPLRSRIEFVRLHFWPGCSRSWRRGAIPRCIVHNWTFGSTRQKTAFSWGRCQCIRACNVLWSSPGRRFDEWRDLEMVLLDVSSSPLHHEGLQLIKDQQCPYRSC